MRSRADPRWSSPPAWRPSRQPCPIAPPGAIIVAPTHAYSGTGAILESLEKAGLAILRRVDISDTAAVIAALEGADVLWAESPTNPMLEVADLPRLFEAAHAGRRSRVV